MDVAAKHLASEAAAPPNTPWPNPTQGWVAFSVDGSFNAHDGRAGTGMILRDDKGKMIFAAYRRLFHCNEALETEIQAMLEGLSLALERSSLPIQLQSDCVVALKVLTDESLDR